MDKMDNNQFQIQRRKGIWKLNQSAHPALMKILFYTQCTDGVHRDINHVANSLVQICEKYELHENGRRIPKSDWVVARTVIGGLMLVHQT